MSFGSIRVADNRFPTIAARFRPAASEGFYRAAAGTVRRARPLTPFRTGHLANSPQIQYRAGELRSRVFWPAPYAAYQEFGRPAFTARPGKWLVFEGRDGGLVFAKRVRAAPGHHYAQKAAEAEGKALTVYLSALIGGL